MAVVYRDEVIEKFRHLGSYLLGKSADSVWGVGSHFTQKVCHIQPFPCKWLFLFWVREAMTGLYRFVLEACGSRSWWHGQAAQWISIWADFLGDSVPPGSTEGDGASSVRAAVKLGRCYTLGLAGPQAFSRSHTLEYYIRDWVEFFLAAEAHEQLLSGWQQNWMIFLTRKRHTMMFGTSVL